MGYEVEHPVPVDVVDEEASGLAPHYLVVALTPLERSAGRVPLPKVSLSLNDDPLKSIVAQFSNQGLPEERPGYLSWVPRVEVVSQSPGHRDIYDTQRIKCGDKDLNACSNP